MNKLPLTLLTAIGFATANPAFAMSDIYLKGGIGWAYSKDEMASLGDLSDPPDRVAFDSDSSIAYQLGIGYRVTDWMDAELSLNHIGGLDLSGALRG